MFSLRVDARFPGLYLITRHFWKKLDIIFGEDLIDGDNRKSWSRFGDGAQS
jgi:hypothetical protein